MTRSAYDFAVATSAAVAFALALTQGALGQAPSPAVAQHLAAAKTAAGTDFTGVMERICREAVPAAPRPATTPAAAATPRPSGPPERSTWHAEPVKVFDNLYFLGQTEYSVWAVTTSAGIIVIDTIFDYSVEDEVANGMKKLGLDPAQIKYAIVSHGHGDHSGGAKYLQDTYGTRVILSAADWDLLDRSGGTKPKRDMVATDGQKLTLGDTTLTLYLTPGHTLGTISTVIPVRDRGIPHVAVAWGGTAFNWMNNGGTAYITPERPVKFWFETYINSSKRFREIAKQNGADVLIANHTIFDGSKTKLPLILARKQGQPNPYVIGEDAVQRYMTVVNECAQAGLAANSK
jgi:metallo-beta-lactamase class B